MNAITFLSLGLRKNEGKRENANIKIYQLSVLHLTLIFPLLSHMSSSCIYNFPFGGRGGEGGGALIQMDRYELEQMVIS